MNIKFRPLAGPAASGMAAFQLLALGFITLLGTQAVRGDDKYWNGSGNNASGVWTSSYAWWSLNAAGTTTASSGVYGGDVAIFSTTTVGTAQTSQLGADLQAAALRFIGPSATTLVGGNGNHTITLFGDITVNSGAGAVTIGSATSGQQVLINQQPNHAWTNLSANPLTIQNNVSFSGTYGNHAINGSGNIVVNGAISGSGTTLTKSGPGILSLNGDNTHTGTLTISAGTLAGSGTVAGNTSISSGAIHSAGAAGAVGIQTFDQPGSATTNLTYETGSIFSWNIDRTQNQTRGVGYDAVNVTGPLASTTGAIFRVVIGDSSFSDTFWDTARTWTDIFTNGSTAKSNWATIFSGAMEYYTTGGSVISPTGQGAFSLSGNALTWTPETPFVPVPEPTAALAGLLLAAGLFRRRRAGSMSANR